jgi:hypothetical protein
MNEIKSRDICGNKIALALPAGGLDEAYVELDWEVVVPKDAFWRDVADTRALHLSTLFARVSHRVEHHSGRAASPE